MQTRTIPATIFFAIFFAVIAVLIFGYSIPARDIAAKHSTSSAQDTVSEYPNVPADIGEFDSTIQKSAVSNSDSITDGPSLLASHCTKCHTAQSLTRIEKGRAEWELTLAQMERMGVRLNDSEKIVLLDYLAVTDSEP